MTVTCPKCNYEYAKSIELFTSTEIHCDICHMRVLWNKQVEDTKDLPSFRMPVILNYTHDMEVVLPDAKNIQVGTAIHVSTNTSTRQFISDGITWHEV